jgi:hypothetical protein
MSEGGEVLLINGEEFVCAERVRHRSYEDVGIFVFRVFLSHLHVSEPFSRRYGNRTRKYVALEHDRQAGSDRMRQGKAMTMALGLVLVAV